MPSVLPPTMSAEDLPEVATVADIAAWERVDPRTLRKACEAGTVPGAFRRGRVWRINTRTYLATIGGAR
jgi:hypothetical protein